MWNPCRAVTPKAQSRPAGLRLTWVNVAEPLGMMDWRHAVEAAIRTNRESRSVTQKHDLLHEFPEHRERIHTLKMGNAHFARLFAEYHEVDHAIHRMDDNTEPACDERAETAKRRRLALKDELYAMIRASA